MDRGRGSKTSIESDWKAPLGVVKWEAPQHRLDVALAWWRRKNGKAHVPEQVRRKFEREFSPW